MKRAYGQFKDVRWSTNYPSAFPYFYDMMFLAKNLYLVMTKSIYFTFLNLGLYRAHFLRR